VQVTQNAPSLMSMALNNAENLTKHYADKGEKVMIDAGHALRSGSEAGQMCRRNVRRERSMHANRGQLLPGSKCMSLGG